ncbi:Protein phosphatase PTC7 -like protein [Echinococcus granulosus]|uniref:Protein phosphatase n=1 Tax=Echinococcus granulosus TaxID=6210 RepID=U6IZW7_ECHGR|nr:Protein phosphatase PTC7 [Echinococcus granulosus]EUB54907.1 Protein phosphatase PTC7 [Echinococcus granulosus]KAH9286197.1 Protein phosphatase PTC7 -like protein [Echinococcus granulosus]CDS15743.1 protein phosphatase ptc7 [Echinococcus granulosus]
MYRIISKGRSLLRTLATIGGRHENSDATTRRTFFSFVTSVSGFDNKHAQYEIQPRPLSTYGDDAYFISITDVSCVLGVADGVGGWRSYGVDPSEFSMSFMSTCQRLAQSGRFKPNEPMLLVTESYREVLDAKTPLLGSATFCVISLCRSDGRLHTVCLGDSGYLVIRHGTVVKRSANQKHTLNTPFQVACLPPNEHGHFYRDSPEQAIQDSFSLEPSDLVVVGTDGLFDNLTDQMILQELTPLQDCDLSLASDELLDWCAYRLVSCARDAAENPNFLSPFANEARQYGLNIAGGVRGDITVMLALVVNETAVADTQPSEFPKSVDSSVGKKAVFRISQSRSSSSPSTLPFT